MPLGATVVETVQDRYECQYTGTQSSFVNKLTNTKCAEATVVEMHGNTRTTLYGLTKNSCKLSGCTGIK